MKKFVSPKDVLEKLSISRSSLYRRIRDKTILSVRLGNRVLIDQEALEKLLTVKPESPAA